MKDPKNIAFHLRTAATLFAMLLLLPATACSVSANDETQDNNDKEDTMTQRIAITVGDKTFTAVTSDTAAARAFVSLLPLTLDMSELNGNEKYFYLPQSLPANSATVDTIHEGDLMLYGNSCVVLFYKTFRSGYAYTRIGRIEDPSGLAAAAGSGSARVLFETRP